MRKMVRNNGEKEAWTEKKLETEKECWRTKITMAFNGTWRKHQDEITCPSCSVRWQALSSPPPPFCIWRLLRSSGVVTWNVPDQFCFWIRIYMRRAAVTLGWLSVSAKIFYNKIPSTSIKVFDIVYVFRSFRGLLHK